MHNHTPNKTDRLFEISVFFMFSILTLFVYRSKSVVDITFCIIIFISIFYLIRRSGRECIKQNRHIMVFLLPLAIGFFISFFSLSGPIRGAIAFIERYRFFSLIIPFALFVRSEKKINILFIILNLSAFIFIAIRISQLGSSIAWGQSIGFHPIGRNSDLLMSIGLINLVVLFRYRVENKAWNIVSKVFIGINTAIILSVVFLMLRRGSYLGLVIGVIVFLLATRKKKLIALLIIALFATLYFSNSVIVQRVKSIVDLKDDNSNRERIQLLRTGTAYLIDERLFFHGTGGKMSYSPYKEYFYSHPSEYQEKNIDIIRKQYFGSFHNSFLQMAVEYGLFFLLCYLASIGYMLVRICRHLPRMEASRKFYPIAAVVITAGVLASQFFHSDLYSYGGLPFILISAAGCVVVNRHRIMGSKAEAHTIANVIAEG